LFNSIFEALFVRAGFRQRLFLGYSTCKASPNPHPCDYRKMEEYFKQNSVKLRMMMGVLNIVTHNSSYKGHKPLVETNLTLPPPLP
jgi:hypothetical protein